MYFNAPLPYFFNIGFFFRVFSWQAVYLSLESFNWGVVYEYNVVVGLFKLQLAIYLHPLYSWVERSVVIG
jgi:hypothetical protein